MTDTFYHRLKEQAEALGIRLSDTQIEQLFTYYEMLVETNKVMNLTTITEESEVVTKHFIDSMAIVKAVVKNENVSRETLSGKTLIDVGTGAGFPGLVLKIVFPELRVTLSDSLQKRLRFLEDVIAKLGLQEVETIHGRAEDLGHQKNLRESFVQAKIEAFGAEVVAHEYSSDDPEMEIACIEKVLAAGADMVLCTGGMSVDPDDKTPYAIGKTADRVVSYGAPVLPGAMFMLAYKGAHDEIPMLGLPGCGMYAGRTIFDLILPRVMAGDIVTKEDIDRLGVGGYCQHCASCTFPNCGFGAYA